MKKFTFLIIIFTLALCSCSSDDDTNAITLDATTTLPGTWNLTGLTVTNGSLDTGISMGAINFTVTGKDFDQTITFNEDNTFTSTGGYTAEINFTTLGISDSQEQTITDFLESGSWNATTNEITFTNTASTNTAVIETITATTVTLELPLKDGILDTSSLGSIGSISLGNITDISGTARITLVKQ